MLFYSGLLRAFTGSLSLLHHSQRIDTEILLPDSAGAIPKKDDKGLAYRLVSKNYSTVTVSSTLSSAGASSSPCLDSIKASAILLVSRRTARIASSFAGMM